MSTQRALYAASVVGSVGVADMSSWSWAIVVERAFVVFGVDAGEVRGDAGENGKYVSEARPIVRLGRKSIGFSSMMKRGGETSEWV